jgi:anti-sigma factor RsiW
MNCQKVQNLISAYVDSELPGLEMLAIRHHLSECPECNGEYESLLSIKRALGSLQPKHLSDELASQVCRRLDQAYPPISERFLSSLRRRMIAHPVRFGLAAVGVSTFAVLMIFQALETNPDEYVFTPASQSASMVISAEQNSASLFPVNTWAEAAYPKPKPAMSHWGFPIEPAKSPELLSSTSLVFTSD